MSDATPFPPLRRVVTAHDEHGQAVVGSDGPLSTVVELTAVPGTIFHEVWSTEGSPAPVGNGPDPSVGPIRLSPPAMEPAFASSTFRPTPRTSSSKTRRQ